MSYQVSKGVFLLFVILTIFIQACFARTKAHHYYHKHTPVHALLPPSKPNSVSCVNELVAKIIQAYGGKDALHQLIAGSSSSKGKVIHYSTLSDAINTFDCDIYSKGNKLRVEVQVLGEPIITAFDGEHGWVKQGDQVFRTSAFTEKQFKEEMDHSLQLLDTMQNSNIKVELVGEKACLGKPCSVLKIVAKDGKPTLFYVDKKSCLILQSEYQGIDSDQGIISKKVYVYEDYRPMDSGFVPYKVTEYSGSRKASETILSSAKYLDLDDKFFEMPGVENTVIGKGESIVIPFEFVANQILVKARINGTRDLTFVLDTGATQSVIDRTIAKSLGEFKESTFSMTTGSGAVPLGYMTFSSMAFDHLCIPNVHMAVADLTTFSQIIGSRPAGLIGANILHQFLVTIDYEHEKIILAHPDSLSIPSEAVIIPTKPSLGMAGLLIEGSLENHPISFLVDTGAAFNNISERLARPLLKSPLLPIGNIQGLDGHKVIIASEQFNNIVLGPLKVPQVVFAVAPSTSNPSGIISGGQLAILGNPFWNNYQLTIDYHNQRLITVQSKEQVSLSKTREKLRDLAVERNDCAYNKQTSYLSKYQDLIETLQRENAIAAQALALAESGLAFGQASVTQGHWAKPLEAIIEDFQHAEALAKQSENKQVQSAILAKWALFYLQYMTRTKDYLPLAKQLLIRSNSAYITEPAFALATAVMLYEQEAYKSSELAIDQALMLDPCNWDALWLKRKLAQKKHDVQMEKLVTAQLQKYYGESYSVKAICPVQGRLKSSSQPKATHAHVQRYMCNKMKHSKVSAQKR